LKICKFEKEVFYTKNDEINEFSSLESQFLSYVILLFSIYMNFIFYYNDELEIIDCKGTPNPKYFFVNENSYFLVLILMVKLILVIFLMNFILPKFLGTKKIIIPSFETFGKKFIKTTCAYYITLWYGYRILPFGIVNGKS